MAIPAADRTARIKKILFAQMPEDTGRNEDEKMNAEGLGGYMGESVYSAYKCPYCPAFGFKATALREHIEKVHRGVDTNE